MKDIMLDLETMSTKNNAAIIAIGAVSFDSNGISGEFYREVSLSDCQSYGMHIDADTVLWWLSQSKEAQDKFKSNQSSVSLHQALADFGNFCNDEKVGQIWGNGSTFDNVILRNAYEVTSLKYPVKFYNDACYRTVRNLNPDVEFERVGIYHYALDDAKSQALHLIKILSK